MEDSLDAGQSFRNDYEESKFCAEMLVRAIDFADHVTVYRPAVISGDSKTGYTNTYHGLYLYLRLMAMMIPSAPPDENGIRHTPIRLRMTGDERRNIIPVEWVSAVICRLFETPEARDLTFHMAPDVPLISREIIEFAGDHFQSAGAEFCGYDYEPGSETGSQGNEEQWLFERLYHENAETYAPYERTDNVFDMTNTKRFAGDIVCPIIDRTVLTRYVEYGNEDRWGKRKPEVIPVSFRTEEQFADRAVGAAAGTATRTIGLDILGPGGSQLTLEVSRSGIHSVSRGLPHSDVPVLSISSDEIESVVKNAAGADLLRTAWDVSDPAVAQELSDLFLSALQPEEMVSRT